MAEPNRDALVKQLTEIVERVASRAGLEVVEVEVLGGGKARVLRIYIDRLSGVSHADCELVSHEVGTILDAEDVIPGDSYTLEVSSPGVERKLAKPGDYERFSGKKAKITLREPVENQRFWEGTLRGLEGDTIAMEVSEKRIVHIPLSQVRKANLKFDW